MAGLEALRNVPHVIRARLYPNYLEHGGKFIVRVKTGDVTRGGPGLNHDTMVDAVSAYFDEAFYQFADGFGVENDCFSIQPTIGGTFDPDAKADKKKNSVVFAFCMRQELRNALSRTPGRLRTRRRAARLSPGQPRQDG